MRDRLFIFILSLNNWLVLFLSSHGITGCVVLILFTVSFSVLCLWHLAHMSRSDSCLYHNVCMQKCVNCDAGHFSRSGLSFVQKCQVYCVQKCFLTQLSDIESHSDLFSTHHTLLGLCCMQKCFILIRSGIA